VKVRVKIDNRSVNRTSGRAVVAALAAALAACDSSGSGAGLSTSCDDMLAARRSGACWLPDGGPFLAHESRGARPGDVLMQSTLARFYITGAPGADGYVPFAGWVVDADLVRGEGEMDGDGVDGYYPVVNVAPLGADAVTIVSDGSDGGDAIVRVTGALVEVPAVLSIQRAAPRPVPVAVTLTYSLGPDDRALRVTTWVANTSSANQDVDIGDVVLFGDDEADAYALPGGLDGSSAAREVDAIGSSHEWRALTYALFAEEDRLHLFSGSTVSDQIGAGDTGMWGSTLVRQTLAPGQELRGVRYLSVGPDISTALSPRLDRAAVELGSLAGRALAGIQPVAGARVSVFADATLSEMVGQAVSDRTGAFELAVPPGRYRVVATGRSNGEYVEVPERTRELADGFTPSAVREVVVEAGRSSSVDLELGRPAHAVIAVTDGEGAPIAAKVTFQAENGLPAPLLAAGERVPYASLGIRQIVWLPAGTAELDLEPGIYTVIASHGFGAELDVQEHVELAAGETTELGLSVRDVIDAADHVAIDTHVHGVYSQHGEATLSERLVTAAAEGLDLHIGTDHDWVGDYSPAIEPAGLAGKLLSAPGVELTTPGGHHCIWPLRRSSTEARGGAALWWWGGSLDEWYEHYRDMGAVVIGVAHGAGYFARAGYDPTTGQVTGDAPFSWDLNAMEVHNGKGPGGRDALVPIWLSLIEHGRRVAPLAASDSHWRVPEVGSGRTYVYVGDPANADATSIARAVTELRTVASTGPFIELGTADGGRPGDIVPVDSKGEVTLSISVRAPSWIAVDEVELLQGGRVIERWDATTVPAVGLDPARAVWFEHDIRFSPEADTWFAVQVRGSGDLAPVYPDVQPWALTSPLFIDVDRDGSSARDHLRRSGSGDE
jgi:hypothetical protein